MAARTLPLKAYADALGRICLATRGDMATLVSGAGSDSRSIQPGGLFCAIPGARQDGTRYTLDAVEHGARAVATMVPLELPPEVPQLIVTDAYAAAGRIAECATGYPARELRLLGVTGTNGKTTCAYLLRHLLRAHGQLPGMVGTVCYDLGQSEIEADRTTPTPFELQDLFARMVQGGCGWAVLEMSSHALVQRRAGTARFAGALFTNLTGDHLDYHKTMEEYFEAKELLFTEYLEPGAPAVVHVDAAYGRRLAERLARDGHVRVLTVGAADADIAWHDVRLGFSGCRFGLHLGADEIPVDSPLIGQHNVANLACAAGLAHACGVPADTIAQSLTTCQGAPGRLQVVSSPRGFAAYVDYAHSDDALENVLKALRVLGPRRLLVVFGCGGDRDRTKRPRMGAVAARLGDRLFVTSDNPRTEDPNAIIAEILAGVPAGTDVQADPDRRQTIRRAIAEAREGDLVLVAGKGHERYQESHGVKHPIDDVSEVRRAMDLEPG